MKTGSSGAFCARQFMLTLLCFLLSSGLQRAEAFIIDILPIQIRDDSGKNAANSSRNLLLAETGKIWAQAGITLNYLAWTTYNETDYLVMDTQTEVNRFFATAPAASANTRIINLWFVESIFDAWGEVNAIGGNKVLIGADIFTYNRVDTIAHELGHVLGLRHDDPGMNATYLMTNGLDRTVPDYIGNITPDGAKLDKMTGVQITKAQSSNFVVPDRVVPEPGSLLLVSSGLAVLAVRVRRKTNNGLAA